MKRRQSPGAPSRSGWPFKADAARLGERASRCHPHHGPCAAATGAPDQSSSQRAFSSRSGDGRHAGVAAPLEAPPCSRTPARAPPCLRPQPGPALRWRGGGHHDSEPGSSCQPVGAAGAQPPAPRLHAPAFRRYAAPFPSITSGFFVPEHQSIGTLLVLLPAAGVPLNRVVNGPFLPLPLSSSLVMRGSISHQDRTQGTRGQES